MNLTPADFPYLGVWVEAFFYGLYSGIFAMYLQCHGSNKGTGVKTKNILFYALCFLYVLYLVAISLDIARVVLHAASESYRTNTDGILYNFNIIQAVINGTGDFISQSILIYRCWIVWGRNIHVVTIPSILAFIFLASWLAGSSSLLVVQDQLVATDWGIALLLASLVASMTVNALVTGLIVFRIFKTFQEFKFISSDDLNFGTTHARGSKLRSIIFVVIESGMTLFAIQLARLVVTISVTESAANAFELISPIYQQLNGITPTIILVRVSMGLSYYDDKSLEEAVGSLHFASDPLKSNSETGSIGIVDQERREDDIEVEQIIDVEVVAR